MRTNNTENGKVKGELTAKIVWIAGAVIFFVLLLSRFLSMDDADESMIDCVTDGLKYLFYFIAYVVGIVYLFDRRHKKEAFLSACIYAAAFAFSFVLELIDGGSKAANDLVNLVLTLSVYVVFAIFMESLAKGQMSGHYSICLNLWFLPTLLLLGVGVTVNLWAELVRPDGFLWDGFMLDTAANIVQIIPIFVMSKVVKERAAVPGISHS